MFDSITTGKYWDRAWSLVDGCTPVSEGCENCWLASMDYRFPKYEYALCGKVTGESPRFIGEIVTRPDRLDIPLKRKKPTVYAIWADLFHEKISEVFQWEALQVMASCRQHNFLVLTKRPERIKGLFDVIEYYSGIVTAATFNQLYIFKTYKTGFDNIFWGTTVENQEQAEKRIPELLKVPGKKFLSIEPMLGEINLANICLDASTESNEGDIRPWSDIDWIIVGGETGTNARPMWPDWVRSIRDQCVEAGVPFYFKKWGNYKGSHDWDIPPGRILDGKEWNERPE